MHIPGLISASRMNLCFDHYYVFLALDMWGPSVVWCMLGLDKRWLCSQRQTDAYYLQGACDQHHPVDSSFVIPAFPVGDAYSEFGIRAFEVK